MKQETTFDQLGLSKPILKSLKENNFVKPTEIQERAIPKILAGRDLVASSKTGSGKTFTFSSGIIQNTDFKKGLQALVLVPTRELAIQVNETFFKFTKYKRINLACIYGGVAYGPQERDLKKANVIIATPGRLIDHMNRGNINLNKLNVLVLDEADLMLDMGFLPDVKKIADKCSKNRQTLLFSATFNEDITLIEKKYMNSPEHVIAEEFVDPNLLTQHYVEVSGKRKVSFLVNELKNFKENVIIFTNTRRSTEFVAEALSMNGIKAKEIHGGLKQPKRERVIKEFSSKKFNVIVCTDVAARGLDIKGVSKVYNYDIPKDPCQYVHRIGRTGRAGKKGEAISLLSPRDHQLFSKVYDKMEGVIEEMEMPEFEKVKTPDQKPRGRPSSRSSPRKKSRPRRSNR